MPEHSWVDSFLVSCTVTDAAGVIIEMNHKAAESYKKSGGKELVGKNMLDCHPGPARSKVQEMLEKHTVNVYTIERNGNKKLIYQAPWYQNGAFAGLVELVLELPEIMPHYTRK